MVNKKYEKAKGFLPWNLEGKIFNSTIFPCWTNNSLFYFQESKFETCLLKVSLDTGEKEKIFNLQHLLDALSVQLNCTVKKLPLNIFSVQELPLQVMFTYRFSRWCYDIEKGICVNVGRVDLDKLSSPDCKWNLLVDDHNLMLEDVGAHKLFQITNDGMKYYDYASSPETNTHTVTQKRAGVISSPIALWSPNSNKIVTHKLDQRNVKPLSLLQNAPANSQRPEVYDYRMSFSGDEYLPEAELIVIDVESKSVMPLKSGLIASPYLTPLEFDWVWWSSDSKSLYFLSETRGSRQLTLYMADVETGETRELIVEENETYVEPDAIAPWPREVLILEEKQEIVWLSERTDYAHIYLYDLITGELKNAITTGQWVVREVYFYDKSEAWLYFSAYGYHNDEDPYYKHLFRCRLDGRELECLTKKYFNHTITISPCRKYFLDTYSTIDTAPVTLLLNMSGDIICNIETANIEVLFNLGWKVPKRFSVKARDGKTKIYGNLYYPTDFDSSKKYPIIDHIYPGPQFYRAPTHFNLYGLIFKSAWTAQALAELGFIVMHIDGLGTPGRSKSFHDYTYENMGDCGLPDHIIAIKQLASIYPYIDLSKVGITGYSGGGYAAARAMLIYPEFFSVGVAAGGNHDLRCYPASYGEKYNSLNIDTYADQSNAAYAKNLQGKLFLVHGEMDDNVHPCATFQLVDALIRHDKDFEMLIMPNQNHASTFDHPYYMKRHWGFFVKHLLGENPPEIFNMNTIPDDFPQVVDW